MSKIHVKSQDILPRAIVAMAARHTTMEITASRHSNIGRSTWEAPKHLTEYHPKFALKTQIPRPGGNASRWMESVST